MIRKKCSRCKQLKELKLFRKYPRSYTRVNGEVSVYDYHDAMCIECQNERTCERKREKKKQLLPLSYEIKIIPTPR